MGVAVILYLSSFAARVITITSISVIVNLFRTENKVGWKCQIVMILGNLKGCLSYLLALDSNVENKKLFCAAIYIVIAFSLMVQGAVLTPIFKSMRIESTDEDGSGNNIN